MTFQENRRQLSSGNDVFDDQDLHWLKYALSLAEQAAREDEVPVGAVVVLDNTLIGAGYNQSIKSQDPTAHAEIVAIREAAKTVDNYRLVDTTLYVTLEPCCMCAGSLLHARVKRLVFGAYDLRAGAVQSKHTILTNSHNHQVSWCGGLLAMECTALLQSFFRARR